MTISSNHIETLKKINSLFENVKDRSWDYNILITETYFRPEIVELDNFSLVTSNFCEEHYGINCIYPPIPNNKDYLISDNDIEIALEYLKELNDNNLGGIFCMPDTMFNTLNKNKFAVYEYCPEYLYDINEQIELAGIKFKSIRRAINQFKRNEFQIEELNRKKHIEECMVLSEKKPIFEQGFYDAIDKYDTIKFIDTSTYGFVVKINNKIVGVSINTSHNNIAYNLVRRVDHNVDGITEFMNLHMIQYYKSLNPNLLMFNDGDDIEIEGLHFFKTKMKPISKKHIYEIYKKEIPLESCKKECIT